MPAREYTYNVLQTAVQFHSIHTGANLAVVESLPDNHSSRLTEKKLVKYSQN